MLVVVSQNQKQNHMLSVRCDVYVLYMKEVN
jgi:hypothetical protein